MCRVVTEADGAVGLTGLPYTRMGDLATGGSYSPVVERDPGPAGRRDSRPDDDASRTWEHALYPQGSNGVGRVNGGLVFQDAATQDHNNYQPARPVAPAAMERGSMVLGIKGMIKGSVDDHHVTYTVLRSPSGQSAPEGRVPPRLIQSGPAVLFQGHCRWTPIVLSRIDQPTVTVLGLIATTTSELGGLLTRHLCNLEPADRGSPSKSARGRGRCTYLLVGEESTLFCALYEKLLKNLGRDYLPFRKFNAFLVIDSGDLQLPSPSSVPPRPSEPRQQQEREAEKRSSPPERRRDEPPGPSPARRNDARPTEPREGSHHLPSRRGEDERPSRREESRVRRSRSPPAASTRRRSRSRDAPPRPTSPLKMPMLCRHGILCRHHESNSCRYVHEDEKDLLRKFFGSDLDYHKRAQKALRNHPWVYGTPEEYFRETGRHPGIAESEWASHTAAYLRGGVREWSRAAYWDRTSPDDADSKYRPCKTEDDECGGNSRREERRAPRGGGEDTAAAAGRYTPHTLPSRVGDGRGLGNTDDRNGDHSRRGGAPPPPPPSRDENQRRGRSPPPPPARGPTAPPPRDEEPKERSAWSPSPPRASEPPREEARQRRGPSPPPQPSPSRSRNDDRKRRARSPSPPASSQASRPRDDDRKRRARSPSPTASSQASRPRADDRQNGRKRSPAAPVPQSSSSSRARDDGRQRRGRSPSPPHPSSSSRARDDGRRGRSPAAASSQSSSSSRTRDDDRQRRGRSPSPPHPSSARARDDNRRGRSPPPLQPSSRTRDDNRRGRSPPPAPQPPSSRTRDDARHHRTTAPAVDTRHANLPPPSAVSSGSKFSPVNSPARHHPPQATSHAGLLSSPAVHQPPPSTAPQAPAPPPYVAPAAPPAPAPLVLDAGTVQEMTDPAFLEKMRKFFQLNAYLQMGAPAPMAPPPPFGLPGMAPFPVYYPYAQPAPTYAYAQPPQPAQMQALPVQAPPVQAQQRTDDDDLNSFLSSYHAQGGGGSSGGY